MQYPWPVYVDKDKNYVSGSKIETIDQQLINGDAYLTLTGIPGDIFVSSEFMSQFNPKVGWYMYRDIAGQDLAMKDTDFEAKYTAVFGGGGGSGDVSWNDIKNKPTIFPPTIGTTSTTAKAGNYVPSWSEITNKPTIPAAQIQSDWNQTDNSKLDFIKNKPTIPPAYTLPTATTTVLGGVKQAVKQDDSTASDAAALVNDFNGLLKKLRDAGILAS